MQYFLCPGVSLTLKKKKKKAARRKEKSVKCVGWGRDSEPVRLFICAFVSVYFRKETFVGDFLCLQILSPIKSAQDNLFIAAMPYLPLSPPRVHV